jgi:hypothetical protein
VDSAKTFPIGLSIHHGRVRNDTINTNNAGRQR